MPRRKPEPFVKLHKDGSVWARGTTLDGVMTGYWEWFRKDGTRLRSGYFENGAQTGEWTTYDASGVLAVLVLRERRAPVALSAQLAL